MAYFRECVRGGVLRDIEFVIIEFLLTDKDNTAVCNEQNSVAPPRSFPLTAASALHVFAHGKGGRGRGHMA